MWLGLGRKAQGSVPCSLPARHTFGEGDRNFSGKTGKRSWISEVNLSDRVGRRRDFFKKQKRENTSLVLTSWAKVISFIFVYLEGKMREMQEGMRERSPICWLTPQTPLIARSKQNEAGNQESQSGLLCQGQGFMYLRHHHCHPECIRWHPVVLFHGSEVEKSGFELAFW